MRYFWRFCFIAMISAALLSAPLISSVDATVLLPPIGCGADGFCNAFCASDPDCGPPQCVHNKACTTDGDCQPLGFCATYRLCVCTG